MNNIISRFLSFFVATKTVDEDHSQETVALETRKDGKVEDRLIKALKRKAPQEEILKLIETPDLDVDYMEPKNGGTLLYWATRYTYETGTRYPHSYSFKVMDALLDKGADPLKEGSTASARCSSALECMIYFEFCNPKMFEGEAVKNSRLALRDKQEKTETILTYLLYCPYYKDQLDCIKTVVEKHPELCVLSNANNKFPIDIAMAHEENHIFSLTNKDEACLEVIDVLTKKGALSPQKATLYLLDTLKDTYKKYKRMAIVLKNVKGIDFGYKDENGNSLIHHCITSFAKSYGSSWAGTGADEITAVVLQNADVNARNNLGQTPAMLGIKEGSWHETVCHCDDVDIYHRSRIYEVKKLYKHPDFDVLATDNQGLMAYHYARVYPMIDVEDFLELETITRKALAEKGQSVEVLFAFSDEEIKNKIENARMIRKIGHQNTQNLVDSQHQNG